MQSYDLLMLIVLGVATVFGAWKGLAWQVASLASIFVSYVAAVRFRGPLASAIDAEPPWNMFLAMLILYVGASLVIWVVFGFIRRSITRLRLKEFDRQIGALVGLAKGVVLCVIITLFAVTLTGAERRETIVNSTSGYYISLLLDRSHALFPPEVHEVLHPYILKLDEDHGQRDYAEEQQPQTPNGYPTYGGPLFGTGPATPPARWPSTPTSNPQSAAPPKATTDDRQRATTASRPLDDLRQWGREQFEAQRRQLSSDVSGEIREQIDRQIERFLPSSSTSR